MNILLGFNVFSSFCITFELKIRVLIQYCTLKKSNQSAMIKEKKVFWKNIRLTDAL